MSKKKHIDPEPIEQTEAVKEEAGEEKEEKKEPSELEKAVKEEAKEEGKEEKKEPSELEKAKQAQAQEHDQYLRLAAEYDNFRKRSQREKDAIYRDAVADTAKKFLPVYDNLQRALKNETADEAFKKGVEMTMTELTKIMEGIGMKPFGAAGDPFDPEKHNAVMHVDDETLGENTVAEVFQTGFTLGDKVIRFAMVKVAN